MKKPAKWDRIRITSTPGQCKLAKESDVYFLAINDVNLTEKLTSFKTIYYTVVQLIFDSQCPKFCFSFN